MKTKHIAGCLFSALMLTCLQQATAQTTYNGSVAKPQGQQMKVDQMAGMAPRCDNQGNWDVWADFLWWSSNLNTVTGYDLDAPNGLTGSDVDVSLHFDRPGSHWDPGVRVGAGWNTGYDNWDIQGYWTYFYNSATKDGELSNTTSGSETMFGEADAKNRLRYNAADFEIGKAYYVSRHFFIRPFTGIHAIWTSLHSSADLESTASATTNFSFANTGLINSPFSVTSSGATEGDLKLEIETWGVGPRIGFNSNWGDFRGFSLLGNISGSLVYGKLLGKASIDLDSANDIDVKVRDHEYWQLMPTMQLLFGVSYATCFGHGQNQFRISAAWESNFIWEAANFFLYDKPISMQGLTVDLRFDF